jgi:hypothetical protein
VVFPSPYAPPLGAAWRGEALVVARVLLDSDATGIVIQTVDARFELIEERRFLADAEGGTVVGVASDGISAAVAYRSNHSSNEPTRLALFGRDGGWSAKQVSSPDRSTRPSRRDRTATWHSA